MADESMRPQGEMPFDGKRMFWGGFETIIDTASSRRSRPSPRDQISRKGESNMTDVRERRAPDGERRPTVHRRSFIWYELMTPDPEGAKAFYDAVVGWNIGAERRRVPTAIA